MNKEKKERWKNATDRVNGFEKIPNVENEISQMLKSNIFNLFPKTIVAYPFFLKWEWSTKHQLLIDNVYEGISENSRPQYER